MKIISKEVVTAVVFTLVTTDRGIFRVFPTTAVDKFAPDELCYDGGTWEPVFTDSVDYCDLDLSGVIA